MDPKTAALVGASDPTDHPDTPSNAYSVRTGAGQMIDSAKAGLNAVKQPVVNDLTAVGNKIGDGLGGVGLNQLGDLAKAHPLATGGIAAGALGLGAVGILHHLLSKRKKAKPLPPTTGPESVPVV